MLPPRITQIPTPRKHTPARTATHQGDKAIPKKETPTADSSNARPTIDRTIPITLTIISDKLIYYSPPY